MFPDERRSRAEREQGKAPSFSELPLGTKLFAAAIFIGLLILLASAFR